MSSKLHSCSRLISVIIAPCLLALSSPAWSLSFADDRVQVHGFASQGFVSTSDNNVNGESSESGGSFDFNEIGLNASWKPFPSLLVAAQGSSVRAGEVIDEDLVLEYALVDFSPWQSEKGYAGWRIGKLKLPFGFYNESRDIVFTRPGVLLPQAQYLTTSGARNFGYFALDGLQLYSGHFVGRHDITLNGGFYIEQEIDETAKTQILPFSIQPFSTDGTLRFDRGWVTRVMDDIDGGRWRLALSVSSIDMRYVSTANEPLLQDGDFRLDQAIVSVQHNRERWSVTAEVIRREIELSDVFAPAFADASYELQPMGYYLQGQYRINPKWELMARYDERMRNAPDRNGHDLSADTGLPRHYFFARDWTAGLRHNVTPQLGIWGEFHYVDGVAWVNPLDNPGFENGDAERYWTLLTLMVGVRF